MVRLLSHLSQSSLEQKLMHGMQKVQRFEDTLSTKAREVVKTSLFASSAVLLLVLGLGTWVYSGYLAFAEVLSPPLAAFSMGSILLLISVMLWVAVRHRLGRGKG